MFDEFNEKRTATIIISLVLSLFFTWLGLHDIISDYPIMASNIYVGKVLGVICVLLCISLIIAMLVLTIRFYKSIAWLYIPYLVFGYSAIHFFATDDDIAGCVVYMLAVTALILMLALMINKNKRTNESKIASYAKICKGSVLSSELRDEYLDIINNYDNLSPIELFTKFDLPTFSKLQKSNLFRNSYKSFYDTNDDILLLYMLKKYWGRNEMRHPDGDCLKYRYNAFNETDEAILTEYPWLLPL